MALRLPVERVQCSPHDRAVCEDVFDGLVRTCGVLIDRPGLEDACHGEPALIRYARDVLGLFASLGQVEHVRRDLWIVTGIAPLEPRAREFVRAAAAAHVLGPWTVIAGAWAMTLHGVLDARHELPGIRFGLTPRPRKLGTYSDRGRRKREETGAASGAEAERRHVSVVGGAPITAVARTSTRLGTGRYLEYDGRGAHVLDVAPAFLSMLEHPRISGGIDAARAAALPVLAHVGLDEVLRTGSRHPSITVRRRLAFVLVDALARSIGTTIWCDADELGIVDEVCQGWRVERALDVRPGSPPSLLEPHRLPSGPLLQGTAVIDNRSAAIARTIRGRGGESIRAQAAAMRARRAEQDRLSVEAELDAIEQRALTRMQRRLSTENRA